MSFIPAHLTKHLPALSYPLNPLAPLSDRLIVTLHQSQAPITTSTIASEPSQETAFTERTTGTTLWPAAQILALYLGTLPSSTLGPQTKVIELGAGTGLVGIVAAALGGAHVVATDVSGVCGGILARNCAELNSLGEGIKGRVDVKVLDWFADSLEWNWSRSRWVTAPVEGWNHAVQPDSCTAAHVCPPFDLILTSDTVYHPPLTPHLIRVLVALSNKSLQEQPTHNRRPPLILLALERRDSMLINGFLQDAKAAGFVLRRVGKGRLIKAMKRAGMLGDGSHNEDEYDDTQDRKTTKKKKKRSETTASTGTGMSGWEGVEIWRLRLRCEEVDGIADDDDEDA